MHFINLNASISESNSSELIKLFLNKPAVSRIPSVVDLQDFLRWVVMLLCIASRSTAPCIKNIHSGSCENFLLDEYKRCSA